MRRTKEDELLKKIEQIKADYEQERQGYILLLRLKDEEIERLKEMIKNEVN